MPEFIHRFRAMGTEVELRLWHSRETLARRALAQAERLFTQVETCLSRFKADSELSRLNRSAGRPFPASPLLFELVELALTWREYTGGIFDPTVLPALLAHGYDRSFEEMAGKVAEQAGQRPNKQPDQDQVGLRPGRFLKPARSQVRLSWAQRSILLPVGVGLDLGGIAKGWTVQQAAQQLGQYGPALVDAGGDIACVGAPPTGSAWLVGVAHPHQPGADIATLTLSNEAVATSSLVKRQWQHQGQPAHHLIDPRTGAPALTDLSSVTVIAPRLPDAEIHAKVALILGSIEGLTYLQQHSDISALLVTATGDQLSCGSLEDKAYVYSLTFAETFLTLV